MSLQNKFTLYNKQTHTNIFGHSHRYTLYNLATSGSSRNGLGPETYDSPNTIRKIFYVLNRDQTQTQISSACELQNSQPVTSQPDTKHSAQQLGDVAGNGAFAALVTFLGDRLAQITQKIDELSEKTRYDSTQKMDETNRVLTRLNQKGDVSLVKESVDDTTMAQKVVYEYGTCLTGFEIHLAEKETEIVDRVTKQVDRVTKQVKTAPEQTKQTSVETNTQTETPRPVTTDTAISKPPSIEFGNEKSILIHEDGERQNSNNSNHNGNNRNGNYNHNNNNTPGGQTQQLDYSQGQNGQVIWKQTVEPQGKQIQSRNNNRNNNTFRRNRRATYPATGNEWQVQTPSVNIIELNDNNTGSTPVLANGSVANTTENSTRHCSPPQQ
ncbi:putative uncharacterized protein DDB_G0282129 [Schistocerca gregaria]|uniref:putative uncharacterized protein DDB_G0282129 n=1 Tax=Schistocerca gregaria TaxID=7010 RepID=UPI00211EE15B|nr:putative uncharacterized protein DDB_G0282129 [Schistocerca gregaria]